MLLNELNKPKPECDLCKLQRKEIDSLNRELERTRQLRRLKIHSAFYGTNELTDVDVLERLLRGC